MPQSHLSPTIARSQNQTVRLDNFTHCVTGSDFKSKNEIGAF